MRIADRLTDGDRKGIVLPTFDCRPAGADGGLCWAVTINEPSIRRPFFHHFPGTSFPRRDDGFQSRKVGIRHHRQQGGRKGDRGDAFIAQQLGQAVLGKQGIAIGKDQSSTTQKREKNLCDRGIKAKRGELQHPAGGLHGKIFDHRLRKTDESSMPQQNAFGFSGRAGGVNDVSKIVCIG